MYTSISFLKSRNAAFHHQDGLLMWKRLLWIIPMSTGCTSKGLKLSINFNNLQDGPMFLIDIPDIILDGRQDFLRSSLSVS